MINAYKCITSVILCLPCVCIGLCLSNQSKRSFVSFHLFKVADSGHDGVGLSWLQPLQLHDRNKSSEVAEDILRFLRHLKTLQRCAKKMQRWQPITRSTLTTPSTYIV